MSNSNGYDNTNNPFTLIMIPIGLYAAALTSIAQAVVHPSPQPFNPPPPNSRNIPDPIWWRW